MMYRLILIVCVFMSACIGTDYVDYPLGSPPSHAEIEESGLSLTPAQAYALSFKLVAVDGSELAAEWAWSSRDQSIATVDDNGLVTAVEVGQTWVDGVANVEYADSVLITVTADPNAVASVIVQGSSDNLPLGESRQLTARVENLGGDPLTKDVSWSSSNTSIATIDQNGLVTAITEGQVSISAEADGIISVPFAIQCGEQGESRMGEFSGRNGYNASGLATLETIGDTTKLIFSDDFSTQTGPGLYIYLSPSDNSVSGGLELGKIISTSGMQTYVLPQNADPNQYNHVIIYCKPFGVLFGVATLE